MYNLNPQAGNTSCQSVFLCSTGTEFWKLMVLGKMHGHIVQPVLYLEAKIIQSIKKWSAICP